MKRNLQLFRTVPLCLLLLCLSASFGAAADKTVGNTIGADEECAAEQTGTVNAGFEPPAVTLQEAVRLAEMYVKEHDIDLSEHYLDSARLVRDATGKVRDWVINWETTRKATDSFIELHIDMQKKVTRRSGG